MSAVGPGTGFTQLAAELETAIAILQDSNRLVLFEDIEFDVQVYL